MKDRRTYIEERVEPDLNSGCWLWGLNLKYKGYGSALIKRNGKFKLIGAHRASWEAYHGPIPEGAWVLHKCDTPACVNPNHLFLGDVRVNMVDCARKGRTRFQRFGARTHCARGHEFTPENAIYRGDGARRCKACIGLWRLKRRRGVQPTRTRGRTAPAIEALAQSMFHQRWPDIPWDRRSTNRTWWRRKAQAVLNTHNPKAEGATP